MDINRYNDRTNKAYVKNEKGIVPHHSNVSRPNEYSVVLRCRITALQGVRDGRSRYKAKPLVGLDYTEAPVEIEDIDSGNDTTAYAVGDEVDVSFYKSGPPRILKGSSGSTEFVNHIHATHLIYSGS